jgi:hypothetical protein
LSQVGIVTKSSFDFLDEKFDISETTAESFDAALEFSRGKDDSETTADVSQGFLIGSVSENDSFN